MHHPRGSAQGRTRRILALPSPPRHPRHRRPGSVRVDAVDPFDPPVSVVLALWATRPSSHGAAVVEGADGAHEVDDPTSSSRAGRVSLAMWLAAAGPLTRAVAVLVSPADPAAVLPGAVDVGECVVAETLSGRRLALVPQANGTSRVWRVHDMHTALTPFDAAQARRDVHTATEKAIETLTELDLACERPELADTLTDLVAATLDPALVPPWLEPRRRGLLERSLRLGAICELALQDDGAAATALQASRRSQVLRPLLAVARTGVSAATDWWAPRR